MYHSHVVHSKVYLNKCNIVFSGDSRINQHPGLTVMHTIWIREHNRIARLLQEAKPHLRPSKIFDLTRKIVIAEIQHITYNEWLPIIIGECKYYL